MGATENTEDTERRQVDEAGLHVDDEMEPDPALNRVTNAIIGALIAVHKELGPGHAEMICKNALALEFRARNIPFEREVLIPVFYRGEKVGETRLDFIAGDGVKVIVEAKAIEALGPIQTSQCISYLRASGIRLAILVNFNVRRLTDGLKRIAY
jgi:GxxExxY protein